jgi:hypothetical protein
VFSDEVITSVDGIATPTVEALKQVINTREEGTTVTLHVQGTFGTDPRDVSFENRAGITLGISAIDAPIGTTQGLSPTPSTPSTREPVAQAASRAHAAGSRLSGLGILLGVLGVLGGVILIFAGLSAKYEPNVILIATGVADALLWVFVAVAADAIGARIKLAAEVAQESIQ